jgi:hypothetical protein
MSNETPIEISVVMNNGTNARVSTSGSSYLATLQSFVATQAKFTVNALNADGSPYVFANASGSDFSFVCGADFTADAIIQGADYALDANASSLTFTVDFDNADLETLMEGTDRKTLRWTLWNTAANCNGIVAQDAIVVKNVAAPFSEGF